MTVDELWVGKEVVVAQSIYYKGICLEELKNNHENHSQDCRDPKPAPSE
jgi:hypothetical protein